MRISCGTAAWKGNSASGFRFDGWRAISGYPQGRCAKRCADSWRKALCVWSNGAKRGTWWRSEEIRPEKQNASEIRTDGEDEAGAGAAINIEEADFLQNATLRKAIHARERNQCFYCLRRTTSTVQCLDHVVPRVRSGCNSYRNLVSSCLECNSQKGEKAADDFLRRLYREGQLNAAELAARLRALDALASGKLRPPLAAVAKPAAN